MPELVVILAEPKIQGNIGAVARVMKNMGLAELRMSQLVGLEEEAFFRAVHAKDILENAEIFSTFEEAIEGLDMLAGTSSVSAQKDKDFKRVAFTPWDFKEKIAGVEGKIGLAFGREDFGLLNSEVKKCDMLVTVPLNPNYPVMNLSHAVGVVLYELVGREGTLRSCTKADGKDKELLIQQFIEIMGLINYPDFKRDKTEVMFRRMIARSGLSTWEYHKLMGVYKYVIHALKESSDPSPLKDEE